MIASNARPSFLTKQVLDTSDVLTLAFGLIATLLAIIAIFATLVARNNRSTQGNSRFTHTENHQS
jgi:type II secretory pathway component PulF